MYKRTKIKQNDITDCGAACIASIAAYYKLYLPISKIRQYASTDTKGTNVLGLIEACEKLGFEIKAAKGELSSLYKIPLPAIAHVQLPNGLLHYVVIYKINKKYIFIMDPADGFMHKKTIIDFEKIWTKIIVLILPGEQFVAKNEKQSNLQRFWYLISPHKSIMLQALIGAILTTILGLSSSLYMQKIIDIVLPEGNVQLLNLLGCIMVFILILQTAISTFKTVLGLITGQHIDARLILGYYKHLLQLPQRFFDTMRVGEIVSRMNDAVKIRLFINDVALSLVVNILIVIFSIGLMFLYYWKLAMIMLSIIPIYVLMYWISNKINKKWQRKLMENSAGLETQLVESINAVGTIKRFGLEDYANAKTEQKFIILIKNIYRLSIKSLWIGTTTGFITQLYSIGIIWIGSYFVIQRALSPGELLSFYALIGYFTGPATSLITANKSIQDALIAADRLFEIIDLEIEKSTEQSITLTENNIQDIHFKNVYFRYGSREEVFKGLTCTIKKNNFTAIVGESGSGKSTMLGLLQNLYPLTNGAIYIGEMDIKFISTKSLRNRISVVPQKIDLFAGTIIENIAVGEFEPNIQKIIEITQRIGMHAFIEQLPMGYYTILNEQGINLSGGQRQRIAIARALYKNPEILILDEATANLDSNNEQQILETLQWFKLQQKTIIVIAHRLSTIKNSDEILVLKNGILVEQGQHQELLNLHGDYSKLWENQQI